MASPASAAPPAHSDGGDRPAPKLAVPNAAARRAARRRGRAATPTPPASAASASASAHQLPRRGAARAQQRGVAAAAVGARRGDRGGQQPGEDRAGDAEEEEQQLARTARPGAPGRARCRGCRRRAPAPASCVSRLRALPGDLGEGGARAAGQRVRAARAWICVVTARRARSAANVRRREQDHVVGRRLRLGAGRRADLLEQRVGRREVDDAVDAHRRRLPPARPIVDRVARLRVQVRRRLLGEQRRRSPRAGERAQLARERLRVAGGQAEHPAGPGALRRAAGSGARSPPVRRSRPAARVATPA